MNDPYKSPSSELNDSSEPILTPVKKPWQRYLISAWLFICLNAFGKYLSSFVVETLSIGEPFQVKIQAGFLLAGLALVIGVIKLNKLLVYCAAGFCILFGLMQVINMAGLISSGETPLNTLIVTAILYLFPSFPAAWYLLTPQMRHTLAMNEKYNKYKRILDASLTKRP